MGARGQVAELRCAQGTVLQQPRCGDGGRGWVVLLLRVRLPNRPGALGAVASALGGIGADINLVEIVEKRGEVEVEELILDLPTDQSVESLVAACDSLAGVEVQWVRNYPRGGGIELDVELHRRMAADSSLAGETLVTAAPLVFRAQWSLLLQVSADPHVTFSTPGAPRLDASTAGRFRPFDRLHRVVLESGWLPGWDARPRLAAPREISRSWSSDVTETRRSFVPNCPGWPTSWEVPTARTPPMKHVFSADPIAVHRSPVAAPLYARETGTIEA